MSFINGKRWIVKPFIFFTLIFVLKSFLAWGVIFGDMLPWKSLLTEIPFVWALFCIIERFSSKRKLGYYMTVNLLVTAIFFAAIMYFKYYGVIVTYHALEQVNQVTAVRNSVFSLMDPYYLLIFLDIIVLGYYFLRNKKGRDLKRKINQQGRKGIVSVVFIISLGLCLFNILPNQASMNEIKKAQEMGILSYEAYTIFANEKTDIVKSSDITQEAINKLKGISPTVKPELQSAAKGKNLIIIQLESFQSFLLGLKLDGQEVTPNLNHLMEDSLYFPNFYQMVGQGNTSDAEFVVNTSFYIPPRGAATMAYVDKELPSLPRLLKENGYQTATFHTNDVEFWNRGELYSSLGWDHYYDHKFFGDEDVFFFGASDDVLYHKTSDKLKEMSTQGQPFYAQVISMSAHHPFTIPEEKYRMKLPERYEGTFVGDYIRSQNYADEAFGQFVEELKANGIWDNSVIMIYGDHMGLPIYSLDHDDKELMSEIYGYEYSYAHMTNIPLLIHGGGNTGPQILEQVGGEIDILPTAAGLLGVSLENYLHFGQNLLTETYNILPERYYLPSGSFIGTSGLMIPGNSFEDNTQYPLAAGGKKPAATEDEYNRALRLLQLSDSYVTQLPDKR
ncbi:LTA synthase family protein [Paenibacillus wynnii]|uniref:LTA synthase family protein n=1 Tax=Paenibacillus wynnii TaxID=268407 RepID=UPI00279481C0|nr:LTA synthase family protein [Paenibacillus wynnii]MDQ0192296.1 phosphoglycerol transferase MdoB-like AlkP superfamily enzyme [Paenibacillus wynnii]